MTVTTFLGRIIDGYRYKSKSAVFSIGDVLYKLIITILVLSLILWLAVFMYVSFYYTYVPAVLHTRPVYLQFQSCGQKMGICSFPSAQVELTSRQQILMVGQVYRMVLKLEMPESPANRQLGMFLVCSRLRDSAGVNVDGSCRPSMLHYRSRLLRTMATLVFSPAFLFGSAEEKQDLTIELFSHFEEKPDHPVTEVFIEIQSQHIEIYSAELHIQAHFTGLRYLMYYWPVVTAAVGVASNAAFLSLVVLFSWFRWGSTETTPALPSSRRFAQITSANRGYSEDSETSEDKQESEDVTSTSSSSHWEMVSQQDSQSEEKELSSQDSEPESQLLEDLSRVQVVTEEDVNDQEDEIAETELRKRVTHVESDVS